MCRVLCSALCYMDVTRWSKNIIYNSYTHWMFIEHYILILSTSMSWGNWRTYPFPGCLLKIKNCIHIAMLDIYINSIEHQLITLFLKGDLRVCKNTFNNENRSNLVLVLKHSAFSSLHHWCNSPHGYIFSPYVLLKILINQWDLLVIVVLCLTQAVYSPLMHAGMNGHNSRHSRSLYQLWRKTTATTEKKKFIKIHLYQYPIFPVLVLHSHPDAHYSS